MGKHRLNMALASSRKSEAVIRNEGIAAEFVQSGEVPAADMAELLEAFHFYDKDGGGTIDDDEIQEVFRCVGVYVSDKQLTSLMDEFNVENRELDFKTFIQLMLRTYVNEDSEDEFRRAFAFVDGYTRSDEAGTSLDGCLSMKTFKRVMTTVGLKIPEPELTQVMAELSCQHDERVSFALFKQICARVQ